MKHLIFFLFFLLSTTAFAQERTISGTISDSDGSPLPGANVLIKGSSGGTIADVNGKYSLNASTGDILVISFIGYLPQEFTVAESNVINISLVSDDKQLSEVVVLGTRRSDRTITESAVPIDIIGTADIEASGFTQTIELLQNLVPSYNASKNSINDGTDHVRPATLRGLGPEHVLVLVNGKRRHLSAVVHVNDQQRGSVGVDLNSIPPSSIERIEVLRDGAAAQYGSDAIAGVINIVLKKKSDLEVSFTYGQNFSTEQRGYKPGQALLPDETDDQFKSGFYLKNWATTQKSVTHTDGQSIVAHIGKGFEFGKSKIHLSAQYRSQQRSNRAGPDPRYNYFGTFPDGTLTRDGGVIDQASVTVDSREAGFGRINHWYGRSEVSDFNAFLNGETTVGNNNTFYYFGGYGFRQSLGPCYYRRANDNRTIREIYPHGFLPNINPTIIDGSGALGYRGKLGNWNIDVSETIGYNSFTWNMVNTHNTSLGQFGTVKDESGADLQKKKYNAGKLSFLQASTNIDLVRQADAGFASPLNIALGGEFRYESYGITPGELGSYINGNDEGYKTGITALSEASGVTGSSGGILDGPNQGNDAPVGCQCFPGFSQKNNTNASRFNVGAYVDLEADIISNFTVGLAGRFEYYSDFGATLNAKLSARWELSDTFSWRGAFSTGFRAPALGQINYSSIATEAIDNVLVEAGTFPVTNPIAQALGAVDLEAEKSVNFSTGIVLTEGDFTLSVDAYVISMSDRVIFTETFRGNKDNSGKDLLKEFLKTKGVDAASGRYFSNALNTRTSGLDVTGRYRTQVGANSSVSFTLAMNFNSTRITNKDDINTPESLKAYSSTPLFGRQNRVRIEQFAPQDIQNLIIQWNKGNFGLMFKTVRYGSVTDPASGSNYKYDQTYEPTFIFSTEASLRVMQDQLTFAIGSNNLMDTYPEKVYKGNSFNGIFPYSGAPPYGFTGRYVYVRANLKLK